MVTLANEDLVIRCIRDRGSHFLEIGRTDLVDAWWDLNAVLEGLGLTEVIDSDRQFSLDDLILQLSKHFGVITTAFADNQYPATVRRLEENAALREIQFFQSINPTE